MSTAPWPTRARKIVEVGEESRSAGQVSRRRTSSTPRAASSCPAFINAHTHIYSALARGLSIVGNNPTNFYEVLDGTWWAIDRQLTLEGTRASADALYIDCIKQGVTTIFDHHASLRRDPRLPASPLPRAPKKFGIRSCLCYEVSDRDGEEKCLQAIQENADFITECQKNARTPCWRPCSADTLCSPSPTRPSTAWWRPTTAAPATTSMCPRA